MLSLFWIPRPEPIGDRADRGLDDRALDAPRAREQTGEEIAGAGGLEQLREDEVVEREERARADGARGVEQRTRAGEAGGLHAGTLLIPKLVSVEHSF